MTRLFYDLHEPRRAVPLLRKLVPLTKAAHGQDSKVHATAVSNVAEALREMGELSEAREYLQQAVDLAQTVHGSNSIRYAHAQVMRHVCARVGELFKQGQTTTRCVVQVRHRTE